VCVCVCVCVCTYVYTICIYIYNEQEINANIPPHSCFAAIRLPDGTRADIRLWPSDPLLALWWLVDSKATATPDQVRLYIDIDIAIDR